MTTTQTKSNSFVWLGWCPNHPAPETCIRPALTRKQVLLAVCILALPLAVMVLPSLQPHGNAFWIFSKDSSGKLRFEDRVFVSSNPLGLYPAAAGLVRTPEPGRTYLGVMQAPGPDGRFEIVLEGDTVKSYPADRSPATRGTLLFTLRGPGSLQGADAWEALTGTLGVAAGDGSPSGRIPAGPAGAGS